MKDIHMMIDIETLDTTVDCAITQAAALVFNMETGELVRGTSMNFGWAQAIEGGTVDQDTINFWLNQFQSQPSLLEDAKVSPVSHDTLEDFYSWLVSQIQAYGEMPIWAVGSHFDIAALDNKFQAAGLGSPWNYNSPRDARTVSMLAFELNGNRHPTEWAAPKVPHDPYHDCLAQIETLRGLMHWLKNRS